MTFTNHTGWARLAYDVTNHTKGRRLMEETEPCCAACEGADGPHDRDCPQSPVYPFTMAIPEFLAKLRDMTEVERMKACLVACMEAWAMSKDGPQATNVAMAALAGLEMLKRCTAVVSAANRRSVIVGVRPEEIGMERPGPHEKEGPRRG